MRCLLWCAQACGATSRRDWMLGRRRSLRYREAMLRRGPAVVDPRLAFLFARIRIRVGGGSAARNGGAWARRRAGLNSRVSANDLRSRDGRCRRILILCCGEIVERRRNRRNAGDAENGIQQGAIFGAEARDFNSLLANFHALLGDHRVETHDNCALRARVRLRGCGRGELW